MLKLGEAGLRDHIRTIGLYNSKAKNIIALSRALGETHGGEVPASREALDGPALMAGFQASYEKLIEFVQGMPEEQLEQRRVFGAQNAPVAEIMDSALVLHGLSNVYHAQSRPLN